MKNPVKRWKKWRGQIYMERYGDVVDIEKYTWVCLVCGRIWLMRQDAQRCEHTDYVWYGTRKIMCLGRLNREELEKLRSKRHRNRSV